MISSLFMLVAGGLALFVATFWLQLVRYRWGRSVAAEATPEVRHGLGIVEGAVFALLGLILAFQFGGAASRLHDRRDLAVQEANAIDTSYLRLDLLPPDVATGMREKFRRYIAARIQFIQSKLDFEAADQAQHETEQLQQELWSAAIATFAKRADQTAQWLVLPALNEMFNLATQRCAVSQTHAAAPIQILLVALALVGATLAGHAMSRSPTRPTLHMFLFAAVISTTVYFIFDMEYPRLGFIEIGAADQPLYELRDSMK